MAALRTLAFWLLTLTSMAAGVVQGVVVEHASGRPMARTLVRLTLIPTPGVNFAPVVVRSSRAGQFLFHSVPDGFYLLSATRDHYFPTTYGQRLPSGRGVPFQVTRDSDLFAELRMRRMAAITGRILDENGIGLPGVNVVAYRTRLPLRVAASAVSDDRGVYRVHDLDPGRYWIRTGPHTLEDATGLLPTFSPESHESRDARSYFAAVDSETTDADVRPLQGNLLRLTVVPQCVAPLDPVTVFISSETERRMGRALCGESYTFDGVAPMGYDVYAEKPDGTQFGFTELTVGRNELVTLLMAPPQRITVTYQKAGGGSIPNVPVSLIVRRQDPSGPGVAQEIKTAQATLPPGYWELGAGVDPGQYVESIAAGYGGGRRSWRSERPTDWFEVLIEGRGQTTIRVVVSDKAGSITGIVAADAKPVAGIPVFLLPVAEQARRSIHGQLQTLTDVNGQYNFGNLPPGDYRIVATFDLNEADDESMDLAHAITVHVEASQSANVAMAPWVAP